VRSVNLKRWLNVIPSFLEIINRAVATIIIIITLSTGSLFAEGLKIVMESNKSDMQKVNQ